MVKHTCPKCGHKFKTVAKTKKTVSAQETKLVDGKTYYGWVVNYTTGPRLCWFSFPDSGRHRKSKAMLALIAARSAGQIRPGVDWLPSYIRSAQVFRERWGEVSEKDLQESFWAAERDNEKHNAGGYNANTGEYIDLDKTA